MSVWSIDLRCRARSVTIGQRVLDRRVDVDRLRRQRRLLRGLEPGGPEVRLRRVHHQRPQAILGGPNLSFGDDDRFLVGRDLGLSLDDVDRGHGADLDPPLVVLQRRPRQLERLLRHLQAGDRVDQIEVGVAHGARGLGQRLPQLDVGDLLQDLVSSSVCRVLSMLKLRSSGCVNAAERPESSCGLKRLDASLVVSFEASHEN